MGCGVMTSQLPAGLIETTGPETTVQEAADRLLAAIDGNEKLRHIATVDHSAGAESVGLELKPTIEIFFGNPALGTPLMLQARTVAIDLPQKILITQSVAGVSVYHNDPAYLASRHGFAGDTPQLAIISGALQKLANVAAGVA